MTGSRHFDLFVYGTLMLPEVMRAVTGGSFPAETARLSGYKRCRLVGKAYPGIIEFKAAQVEGLLYRNLDMGVLPLLDAFEGEEYERELVEVQKNNGKTIKAFVYMLARPARGLLSDEHWDVNRFTEVYMPGYLHRCSAWRRKLENDQGKT